MKNMRKCFSILLALVMVFALAATAMAANVTLPGEGILAGHSFVAYQIFTGKYDATNKNLSDIDWGTGINEDAFLKALQDANGDEFKQDGANIFASCKTAADVAKALSGTANDSQLANAVAKLAYANKSAASTPLVSGTTELPDGYYLIDDVTQNVGEGGAYNAALLQVVGSVSFTAKTEAPTVEKKVREDDKAISDSTYGSQYNDVADYDIGEDVPFRLIGKVPDMSRYTTYAYAFHDDLSGGLTLKNLGTAEAPEYVRVYYAGDKAGTDKTQIAQEGNWTFTAGNGGQFTVAFNDLKDALKDVTGAAYIIVEYEATLNGNAVIGLDGNTNGVYLEYSNNPNGEGTGQTKPDEVIVFTYELDTTKVDKANPATKLPGAEFVLWNKEKSQVAVVDKNTFTVTGWAAPTTNEKNEKVYPVNSVLTSGADGLFKVIGLDDGTYYLQETQAPSGYNLLTDMIQVIVEATTSNGQTWTRTEQDKGLTALKVKVKVGDNGTQTTQDGNAASGVVAVNVENSSGSTLPSTGGMGTTILYIAGGALVAVAAVMLIVKRRMTAEK